MVQAMDKPASKESDAYVAKFERFEREAHQPSWMTSMRRAGMERFSEVGFPTLRDEDWRFTNVAPIARLPFKPVFQFAPPALTPQAVAGFTFGGLAASRLVFINGHYMADLSSPGPQPAGVIVSSLAEALAADSGAIEKHLAP